MKSWARHHSIASLVLLCVSTASLADPGKPVAVRWWGQGMVSIETYWNLTVVIDPYRANIGYEFPQLSGDLVLVTHEHFDHNNVTAVGGEPNVARGLGSDGEVREFNGVLDRRPNAPRPKWVADAGGFDNLGHPILIRSIPAHHDDQLGKQRGNVAMFRIDVDGVRIVHCGDLGQAKLTDEQLAALGRVDVLLIPVGGIYTIDGPQAAAIIAQVKPRYAIPLHYKTPALGFELHGIEPFVDAVRSRFELVEPIGNTLAVGAHPNDTVYRTRVVVLGYEPWQPSEELAELFAHMERACHDAQEVFQPLSVEQMNFRPSNGTHTPRWNAEHMMGRELLFFTQIYAALDPAIAPIDLNPDQMPPDYKPAHPNWTGAEEARQMERVSAYVRRFAYLLDGVGMDDELRGSRWTLRRLLRQMERHFGEHTANVRKKFDSHDWPAD